MSGVGRVQIPGTNTWVVDAKEYDALCVENAKWQQDFRTTQAEMIRAQDEAKELRAEGDRLRRKMMAECLYELVDATIDETYYTIGLFSSKETAAEFVASSDPDGLSDIGGDHDQYIKVELRERPIDKWSSTGKTVRTWEWAHEYNEAADEYKWVPIKGDGDD